jgi:hypothetical protein
MVVDYDPDSGALMFTPQLLEKVRRRKRSGA